MPTLKNTLGADTANTVVRFIKNQVISGYNYTYPMYYVQLNNKYIGNTSASASTALWKHKPGDTVVIKAEINNGVYGPIWGSLESSNDSLAIVVEDGDSEQEVHWIVDGNVVAAIAVTAVLGKPHEFGWIGVEENSVKKCQPLYDGAVVPGSSAYTFADQPVVLIGGAYVGSGQGQYCISSESYSWAIRIYEVIAETQESGSWHLYACKYDNGSSATLYGLFEARNRKNDSSRLRVAQDGASISGVTPSVSTENFPTAGYGIQLSDIKILTGSGYNDLLAIMADDGGIDTRTGWDSSSATAAYKLTRRSDSAQIPFAFWLGSSSQSGRISIPSGYDYPSTGSTPVGQLVSGRQPKWSIWNDSVKFGKYADVLQSGGKKAHFNIFYDNAGTNLQKVRLEKFEGYDSSKNYAPNIGLSGELYFDYHNGLCSRCTTDTKLMGGRYDRCCVFAFNRDGGGLGNVRLGNLPLWNYSDAEQEAAVQTGLANLMACGAGLRITCFGAQGTWEQIAMMCKNVQDTGDMVGSDPLNFSSDSNAATKAMFKTTGFDATSIISDTAVEYMRDLLYEFAKRDVKGELVMLRTLDRNPETPNVQIDCTELVPKKQSVAKGGFDGIILNRYPSNYQVGTGYDRFIVGEPGGKATIGNSAYNIEIIGDTPNDTWGSYGPSDVGEDCMNQRVISQIGPDSSTEINHGYGIDLGFALKTPNANSCLKIFGSDSDTVPVMAFMSVYAESKTLVSSSDEEVSPTYPYTDPVNFTTIQVPGEFKDCDATIDVGTVTRTDVSNTEVNFNVYLPYSEYGTYSKLVLYVSTNANIARIEFNSNYTFNVSDSVLSITVSDVVVSGQHKAQIAGYVYKNSVTIHSDITSSYHLSGKYFGFSKVVNCCSNASIRNYEKLFVTMVRYNPTEIQPSGYNITGGRSYDTNKWRGSAIFMWKDLMGTRNTATQRPSDGITCYMRVFAQNSGIHAWMPYLSNVNPSNVEGEAYFDNISENYHSWLNNSGETTVKDIYFHNPGELIENSSLGSSNFVDVWMTLWNTTGNPHTPQSDTQVTAANALDGETLTLYEEVLHEPKDSASGADPVELCHFTFNSSASTVTGKDSNDQDTNYHLYMESGLHAPFYSRLPVNTARYGQFDNVGFYHLWITNSAIQPSTGSMYYIKITTPSNNN